MDRKKLEKNIASNLTIDLDVEKFIEVTLLDIEKYANQRVIEEVNEFKLWLYKEYSDKFIDIDITLLYKLFKELKQ